MALRCLLVSLVASLGFELPSNQDVTSWTISGRNWVSTRAVELTALQAEASGWLGLNDPTMQPKPEPVAADRSGARCSGRVGDRSDRFTRRPRLRLDRRRDGPGVRYRPGSRTSRGSDPRSRSRCGPRGGCDRQTVQPQPEARVDDPGVPRPLGRFDRRRKRRNWTMLHPTRLDRLSSAVRLTCEAVQAWASVIQTVGDEVDSDSLIGRCDRLASKADEPSTATNGPFGLFPQSEEGTERAVTHFRTSILETFFVRRDQTGASTDVFSGSPFVE